MIETLLAEPFVLLVGSQAVTWTGYALWHKARSTRTPSTSGAVSPVEPFDEALHGNGPLPPYRFPEGAPNPYEKPRNAATVRIVNRREEEEREQREAWERYQNRPFVAEWNAPTEGYTYGTTAPAGEHKNPRLAQVVRAAEITPKKSP